MSRHLDADLGWRADDAHYPARPNGPLARRPKATSAAEAEFVSLGELCRAPDAHTDPEGAGR